MKLDQYLTCNLNQFVECHTGDVVIDNCNEILWEWRQMLICLLTYKLKLTKILENIKAGVWIKLYFSYYVKNIEKYTSKKCIKYATNSYFNVWPVKLLLVEEFLPTKITRRHLTDKAWFNNCIKMLLMTNSMLYNKFFLDY